MLLKISHLGWSLFYNQAVGQVYNLISLLSYLKLPLYKFVKFPFKNKKTLNLVQKIPLLVNLRQNVNRLLSCLKSAHASLANIPKFQKSRKLWILRSKLRCLGRFSPLTWKRLFSYLKPLSYFVKTQNSALKKKIAETKSPYLSIFGVEFEKNYCHI